MEFGKQIPQEADFWTEDKQTELRLVPLMIENCWKQLRRSVKNWMGSGLNRQGFSGDCYFAAAWIYSRRGATGRKIQDIVHVSRAANGAQTISE